MIMKTQIPSTGRIGWNYISAVDNFYIAFYDSKDFKHEKEKMNKMSSNGINKSYCWYDEKNDDGFIILTIWKTRKNEDQRLIKETTFILTNKTVFLLNDDGDTIERLYK